MKTLVIAGGEASRWGGRPKHLEVVEGEVLLHRTVKQFMELGLTEIISREGREGYTYPGVETHNARLDRRNKHADRFKSSYHRWDPNEVMVLAYGDVWFSDEAISKIENASQNKDWAWVARLGPSELTGGDHGEGFAFVLPPAHHQPFRDAVDLALRLHKSGKMKYPPRGWGVWQVFEGKRDNWQPRRARYALPHLVEVDDWTEDFDTPQELEIWVENRSKRVTDLS